MSHVPILDKKYICGRGNSKGKDPEVRVSLARFKNNE